MKNTLSRNCRKKMGNLNTTHLNVGPTTSKQEGSPFFQDQAPSPRILSLQQINELRIELWHIIKDLSTNRLKQMMGMINCYTFALASRGGAIRSSINEEKTIRTVVKERLMHIAYACVEGLESLTTTVLWMQKYLREHWEGACNSCPSIRKMRVFMRDVLGLFDFTPQEKGQTVFPPNINNLDLPRMLITFEVCEQELLGRHVLLEGEEIGSELQSLMPSHMGAMVMEIFNAFFFGITKYNRAQGVGSKVTQDITFPDQEITQDVTCPPPQDVVWQWSHCYAIAHKIWINLAKKYQRVTGKKIAIDPLEPVDWDEVANKTKTWMEEQMYEADIPY